LVRHREPLSELFFQVLVLCGRAGMVKVGTVAVDSTKLAANASLAQNRTYEGLRREAAQIIEEAIETDAREDALYGDKRGDELPQELADPRTRKARIKELLEQAQAEIEPAREQAAALAVKRAAGRQRGRAPAPEGARRLRQLENKKFNLTDPDSGIVRHRGMLMQGYNIQTVVGEGQVILSARASGVSPDGGQLGPSVAAATANLTRVGITQPIADVLADSGYWHHQQVADLQAQGVRVLVPPRAGTALAPDRLHPKAQDMLEILSSQEGKTAYQRRQQIIEPVFAHWKHIRGITRVLRRGRQAVQAEIDLIATTHNLLKLRTALQVA
jgi:hypothetical protein